MVEEERDGAAGLEEVLGVDVPLLLTRERVVIERVGVKDWEGVGRVLAAAEDRDVISAHAVVPPYPVYVHPVAYLIRHSVLALMGFQVTTAHPTVFWQHSMHPSRSKFWGQV